mgnify:CR=1 FL=1
MQPLTILQCSTRDVGGGAERVASDLFQTYRRAGHASGLAVGYKRTDDPDVFCLPHEQASGLVRGFFWRLHRRWQPRYSRSRWARLACRWSHDLAAPGRILDRLAGREDFHYPATQCIPTLMHDPPDVIHYHNLHGDYFDLRQLPALSAS